MGRKKRKADEPPPPAASAPAPDAESSFRPWPDLPQDILLSIRDRFSISIPDLLAFSSVCRSWRSASAAPFAGPPLLLVPSATLSESSSLRWSGPPQCRLKALTATTRSYRSPISSKTLKKRCVGCSNGHLIFVGYKKCLLADVFTGREVHPPDFPAGHRGPVYGILTAPLSSASCLLLLFPLHHAHDIIICWKPGTDYWSKLEPNDGVPVGITIIGVFKDRILVMDWHYNLIELDFFPRPSCRYVQATKPGVFPGSDIYERYLVECGEDLLLVCIAPGRSSEVYRLDWSGSVWVRMDGLGDWCLFIDDRWKFAVACHDPRRWGGRDNCIYFTLWGADTWVVVPLGSILTYEWRPRRPWPAPFWVYPSMLKWCHLLQTYLV